MTPMTDGQKVVLNEVRRFACEVQSLLDANKSLHTYPRAFVLPGLLLYVVMVSRGFGVDIDVVHALMEGLDRAFPSEQRKKELAMIEDLLKQALAAIQPAEGRADLPEAVKKADAEVDRIIAAATTKPKPRKRRRGSHEP